MIETGQLIKLLESTDAESWERVLCALARALGFDHALFGMVICRHVPFEQAFIRSDYPPKWRSYYDENRLAYCDPTVEHCLKTTVPLIWCPATFTTPDAQTLYEEAAGYGIKSGVTLPIHGPAGECGAFSLASDVTNGATLSRGISHQMGLLSLLRDYAFASAVQFTGGQQTDEVPSLTRRELEVLKWVMAGKSSWEISMIIRCSEATINFHLGNVRQKFNVNTRQQAVVKAIALGLLVPEDHRLHPCRK